jgi:membrane-associated phospholipid phosphatase
VRAHRARRVSRRRSARRGTLAALDVAAFRAVRSRARHPGLIGAAQALSFLGEHAGVWLAGGATGVLLDGDRRADWCRATVAVAGAHAANIAVKRVVRRQRPLIDGLPALAHTPSTLSFPSAHAASSFAAARAYSPLLSAAPLYAAAEAMGISRVFLGVHFPSDVAAGAALGVATGTLAPARHGFLMPRLRRTPSWNQPSSRGPRLRVEVGPEPGGQVDASRSVDPGASPAAETAVHCGRNAAWPENRFQFGRGESGVYGRLYLVDARSGHRLRVADQTSCLRLREQVVLGPVVRDRSCALGGGVGAATRFVWVCQP